MLLLGKAFGVGWASFDDQPHDFNGPTNTVEIVIAGLVLLFGTQQGDVDALLSTNVPFVLNSETDRLFELKELELTTAAEEFWFAYATEWIDTIEMVAELPARMKYTRNTKNVQVTNLTDSNEDLQEDVTAFEAAGYLVHEASHGFVDAHIACATGVISCDMDQESAYGIETWWRYRWLLKNAAELDLDACQRAVDVLESNCRSMFDEGDYPPCVATEALCG